MEAHCGKYKYFEKIIIYKNNIIRLFEKLNTIIKNYRVLSTINCHYQDSKNI